MPHFALKYHVFHQEPDFRAPRRGVTWVQEGAMDPAEAGGAKYDTVSCTSRAVIRRVMETNGFFAENLGFAVREGGCRILH